MMQRILLLPNVNQSLIPSYLLENKKIKDISNIVEDKKKYNEIKEYLRHIQQPNIIVGSDTTQPIFWIIAQNLFLNALLIVQTDDSHIDIKTGETISEKKLEDNSYSENWTNGKTTPQEKELLKKIFELSSSSKNRAQTVQVERLLSEAASQKKHNPNLLQQAIKAKKMGIKTYNIFFFFFTGKYNKLLDNEFSQYWDELRERLENKGEQEIYKALQKKLYKKLQEKRQRKNKLNNRLKTSTVEIPHFNDHHPNSIRHLPPLSQWSIFIDETGTNFNNNTCDYDIDDLSLGKCIALIVPTKLYEKNTILPPIGYQHATNSDEAKNDTIINTVLKAPVGVLGFSIIDEINSRTTSWFNSIYTLIKWVVKLIPINTNKTTELTFYIEERSEYNTSINLLPIIDVLLAELSEINPNRYRKVKINAKFIDKYEHPLIGYADTIAHMWGSPSPISQDRLRKSKMLGHCLIRPSDNVMERLYHSLDSTETLEPNEWYEITSAVADEPKGTLLHDTLNELGEIVQNDQNKWIAFLEEVRKNLSHSYNPLTINTALNWLEKNTPQGLTLSPLDQLHKLSVEIDRANHLGNFDSSMNDKISKIKELREKLFDEYAKELCEIDLRLIISYSNIYEFSKMKDIIDYWQKVDTATITKETKGKLISSEGQYYAFIGNNTEAVRKFDEAISLFKTLSDNKKVEIHAPWTSSYKAVSLLDLKEQKVEQVRSILENSIIGQSLLQSIKSILTTPSRRFEEYLMLRTFVYYPTSFSEEIQEYINKIELWNDGDSHPYQIINFYRAWLLFKNDKYDLAKEFIKNTFDICNNSNEGVTIKWIGYTLQLLATKIGIIKRNSSNIISKAEKLSSTFSALPIDKMKEWEQRCDLKHSECLQLLEELTPFNFH